MQLNRVDSADGVQMAVQGGIQLCENYGACQEVCPQHIRIIPAIHLLQNEAAKRNLRDNNGISSKFMREMTEGFL
jgi:succinate dehydrogenase/fumarate reductase-like Fe-S protein